LTWVKKQFLGKHAAPPGSFCVTRFPANLMPNGGHQRIVLILSRRYWASNIGRQEHLIPLRMGRMAAAPFAFLRGSACVMAADLSTTPIIGIPVVMDGDAHLNNFGLYGTPQH
jgi:uncharacterized protein (DUF2252 family)